MRNILGALGVGCGGQGKEGKVNTYSHHRAPWFKMFVSKYGVSRNTEKVPKCWGKDLLGCYMLRGVWQNYLQWTRGDWVVQGFLKCSFFLLQSFQLLINRWKPQEPTVLALLLDILLKDSLLIMCQSYYNLIEKHLALAQCTWNHRVLAIGKNPFKLSSSIRHFIRENKEVIRLRSFIYWQSWA